MKNFPQIAARIFNRPLLLDAKYATVFFGALSERLNIQSLIDVNGDSLSQVELKDLAVNYNNGSAEKAYHVVGNIAVIPIQGTLTHNLGTLHPYSGMTGYDGIEAKINVAMSDKSIKGILLDIDSPGGEVSGCFDLTDHIYRLRDIKPIWSISNEFAASAAYSIASSASRIITPRTGGYGSVGVLTAHVDHSEQFRNAGVDVKLIFSGDHKVDGNPYNPLPKVVEAKIQGEIDSLRELFVKTVARNLNKSYDDIFDTQASVYYGKDALDIGMAHDVMSFNETLIEFQRHLSETGTTTIGTNLMATETEKANNELESSATAGDITKAKAASHDKGIVAGVDSERTRISKILGSEEAKGRDDQAKHLAFSTSMSSEDAIAVLATAPKSQPTQGVSPLDAAMEATEQPDISGDDSGNAEMSASDKMFASYDSLTGTKAKT